MEFYHFIVGFFRDGGFFLYPLAAIFVVGVAISIERFIYLSIETTSNRRLWGQVVPLINAGNFKQVVAVTSKSKAAIATVLNYGIARLASARRRDDVEKAMDESLLEIIPRMEKRTHYLSALANIGMLVGPARHGHRPDLGVRLDRAGQPGGEGQPARGQHLGRHEQHGLGPVVRDHAAARPHVPRSEDHQADRQPGNRRGEVPQLRRRASPGRGRGRRASPGAAWTHCPRSSREALQAAAGARAMSQSKVARRVSRNHARYRGRHDINVVPMIDMMIILVFFLIFTAVFTKTNILELNLPGADSAVPDLPEGLNLEVIVRADKIEVADRGTGLLKSLPSQQGAYDLKGLQDYLALVKTKYSEKTDATILLEQEIAYDTLVKVMDTVRVFPVPGSKWDVAELFPDVSVGDAPT